MDRGAAQGFGPRSLSPQLYVLSTIPRPPARSDAGGMENTTILQISELRQNPADRVVRRCGKLLSAGLRSVGAAWFDPRNCNAFWIGAFPVTWDSGK